MLIFGLFPCVEIIHDNNPTMSYYIWQQNEYHTYKVLAQDKLSFSFSYFQTVKCLVVLIDMWIRFEVDDTQSINGIEVISLLRGKNNNN